MSTLKIFHKKKILLVFLLCAAMLVGLVGRLGYLMLFQSEYYHKKATDLHERERDIKAARGRILDVNGTVLFFFFIPYASMSTKTAFFGSHSR